MERKAYYTITKTGINQYKMEYWLEHRDNVDMYKNEMTLTSLDADGTTSTKTVQMKVPSMVSATDESNKYYWKTGGIPVNAPANSLSVGGTYFEVEDSMDSDKAVPITLEYPVYGD